AKVVYDPAKNGVIVAHDLDTLRLAENSRIHAERLVSCGDFSVFLKCVSVEPTYYLCAHAIHSHVHKDARRRLCGPIIETRASGAATPDALPCPGRWYRVVLMPSHYSASASNRLPRVIALEFAPGQCQVLPLNRLPFAHLATGEFALFIRDRRRLPPLPFANLAFVVTLLLAFLIALWVLQSTAFGGTR